MRAQVSEDLLIAGDKAQHDLSKQPLALADVRNPVFCNLQKIHGVKQIRHQEEGVLGRRLRRAVKRRDLELVGVDTEVVLAWWQLWRRL